MLNERATGLPTQDAATVVVSSIAYAQVDEQDLRFKDLESQNYHELSFPFPMQLPKSMLGWPEVVPSIS